MAAAVKALNARIRANPVLDYFCSTHFWGPASNFGIPLAAIADSQKDPEIISGNMTAALTAYSAVFMRYSMAVRPKNYLLFACHLINCSSQAFQGYRYVQYWHFGGREEREAVRNAAGEVKGAAAGAADAVAAQAKGAAAAVKQAVGK